MLANKNRNAVVFERATGKEICTLDLDQKEMSASLFHNKKLFIGTYVDFLFMFDVPQNGVFTQAKHKIRTHDSILSIAPITDHILAIGQAAGYVDFISVGQSMDNITHEQFPDSGYINKVAVLSTDKNELAFGCEKGLFFGKFGMNTRRFHISAEEYFKGNLISQVFEYAPNKLIASDYFKHGFFLVDRASNDIRELQNLSYITKNCTDIKPMPFYNFEKFPYLLTRTQFTINLIDLKKENIYPLLFDRKPDFDNEFMSLIEDSNGKIGIVYAVMTKDSKQDAIKSIILSKKFINGLYHFASV